MRKTLMKVIAKVDSPWCKQEEGIPLLAADTVGCCSLRIEHVKLFDELRGEK